MEQTINDGKKNAKRWYYVYERKNGRKTNKEIKIQIKIKIKE